MNKTLQISLRIIDDNDFIWNFDGSRVYYEDAEEEFEDESENGYYCSTWKEAIEILIDGGYLVGLEK